MGCGTSMIKYFLFLFNFLTAIFAIALFGYGIHDLVTRDQSLMTIDAIIVTVMACLLFGTAIAGTMGIQRRSKLIVVIYASSMAVLVGLELMFVGIFAASKGSMAEEIRHEQLKIKPDEVEVIASYLEVSIYLSLTASLIEFVCSIFGFILYKRFKKDTID